MDKLDQIFALQTKLQTRIKEERNLQIQTKEEWLQKLTLAMISEMSELLNEINYKWWKNPKKLDEDAIADELSDIMHFFVSMCIEAGLSAEDLFLRYTQKNKENHDRQDGTSEKTGYALPKKEN